MDVKVKVLTTKQKHNMNRGTRRNHYTTVRMPSCKVCGGTSSGYHFGVITCEACKAFYRRALQKKSYSENECQHGNRCSDIPANIITCIACRFKKCLQLGMSIEGVRKGRYSVELRVKSIQEAKLEESKSEPMAKVSKLIERLPSAQFTEEFDINSDLAHNKISSSIHGQPPHKKIKTDSHIAGFNDIPGTPLYMGGETGTAEYAADFNSISWGNTQLTGGETGTFNYSEGFNDIYGGNVSHIFDNTPILEHTAGSSYIAWDSIRNFKGATDSRKRTAGSNDVPGDNKQNGFNGVPGDNNQNMCGVTGSREHTVGFNGVPWDNNQNLCGVTGSREHTVGFNGVPGDNNQNLCGVTGSREHTVGFNGVPGDNNQNMCGATDSREHTVGFNGIPGDNNPKTCSTTDSREHTVGFNGIPGDNKQNMCDATDSRERTVGFNGVPGDNQQNMCGVTGSREHTVGFNSVLKGDIRNLVGSCDFKKHTMHLNDILQTARNVGGSSDSREETVGFNAILPEDNKRNIGDSSCSEKHTAGFNGIPAGTSRHVGDKTDAIQHTAGFSDIPRDTTRVGGEIDTTDFTDVSKSGIAIQHWDGESTNVDVSACQSRVHIYPVSNKYTNEGLAVERKHYFEDNKDMSSIAMPYDHQRYEQHCDSEEANDGGMWPLYGNTEQWSNSTSNTEPDPQHSYQHIPDGLPTSDTSQHVTAVNDQGRHEWCYHVDKNIQKRDYHKVTTVSRAISNIDAVPASVQIAEKKDTKLIDSVIRQLITVQGMLFPAFQVTDDIIREQKRIANEYKTWKTDYLFMSEPTNIVSNEVFKGVMSSFSVELDDRLVLLKNYAKNMEKNLVFYIFSSKYIPGFDMLDQDDVSRLLKASHVDFWLFTNFMAFNTDIGVSAGTDGVMNAHAEVLSTFFTKEYIDQVFSISETLNKMNFTLQELSVIRAILLTFTDRCFLRRPDKVDRLQQLFVRCLRFQLSKTTDKASERFCKIMDRIVAARSITHLSSGVNAQVLKDWGFVMKDFQLWSEMMMFSCEL